MTKKIYKKEEHAQELTIEDIPMLNPHSLAVLMNDQLGIGKENAEIFIRTLSDCLIKVFEKGAGISLGNHIEIKPVLVTEEVSYAEDYSGVYKVIPEHREYRLFLTKELQEKLFGKIYPEFVLYGSTEKSSFQRVYGKKLERDYNRKEMRKRRNKVYNNEQK